MGKRIAIWILQIVLSLFVIGGAVNDGFSYFFLAIPFAIVFLIVAFGSQNKIHRNYGIGVLILALFFVLTRTHNPILYSSIGEEISFIQPIPVTKFTNRNGVFTWDEDVPIFTDYAIESRFVEKKLTFPAGEYRITSIRPDHPEFGTIYYYFLTNVKTGERFQVGSVIIGGSSLLNTFDKAERSLPELVKLSDNPGETIKKFRAIRPVFFKLSLLMTMPVWPNLLREHFDPRNQCIAKMRSKEMLRPEQNVSTFETSETFDRSQYPDTVFMSEAEFKALCEKFGYQVK